MIRKTVLFTALFVASVSPAMSEQWMPKSWKHLGSDGVSTHYFYNPKTFSVSKDNIVSVWSKKEYNVDAAAMAKDKLTPDQYAGTNSAVSYDEYDCAKMKKRAIIGKTYVGPDFDEIRRSDWKDVEPKSVDEALTNAMCQEMKKRKESAKQSK